MMSGPTDFRWRPMLLPVYGPTAMASLGLGAIVPMLPIAASSLGAGVGMAAAMVALLAVGQLVGDLPAGLLAARLGERRALLVAAGVDAAAMITAYFASSLAVLAAAIFVEGMATAVFHLARHAWMTEAIPLRIRARALSALGGTSRIGLFIGPFIASALVALWSVPAVFGFAAATGLAAGLLTLTAPELPGAQRAVDAGPTVRQVVRTHLRVLATVGIGVLLLQAARTSKQAIVPLWAHGQHLDPSVIGVIVGIASGVELLLVYPGGAVMDRYGRGYVAVPALIAMGAGLAVLPLAHTAVTITLVACLMGAGNGMSSGLVLTMGSDAAPVQGRAQFLGAWRFLGDTGGILGPGIITVVTVFAPLAVAAVALAGVCACGAGWLAVWAPRRPRGPTPDQKRAGSV